jgi:hypothetical protein
MKQGDFFPIKNSVRAQKKICSMAESGYLQSVQWDFGHLCLASVWSALHAFEKLKK